MQLRISPSMRSITISSSNGVVDSMKVRVAPPHTHPPPPSRHVSYRTLFRAVLALAFFLPFVFILTAVVTLEGVNNCSSLDCLGRRLGPRFLGKRGDDSTRLVKDLYDILNEVSFGELQVGLKLPESFVEFLSEMKNNQYDAKTFAIRLKATMEHMDREVKRARLAEQLHKYYAASAIPKGIHCFSLRLTDEYSSNAHARKQLPPPELLPLLSDNSYQHFVLASDNILAASVVVTSAVRSSSKPDKIVFHVITDKKTYPGMHSWFALNPISPAIVEVRGVHQFDWLTRENVPVLEAVENHHGVQNHYHGYHVRGTNISDNPRVFASKLQARSPKYISLLNHLRIYLPEQLFPNLKKVVFLDDDVVVQHDLSHLWEINLTGKVNGAVETCKGKDKWVMSKRFRTYFNFSHPLIAKNLDPNECAWAYGMNIFDLAAWRRTNIKETYHFWLKENLKSNLTLWKFGTLPPALIAFRGHVHAIDPSWHMLGLGYQEKTDLDSVRKAAVIHFNGQCKPWLGIGYKHLQPFWTKHVNYSNDFIRNCHILEPQ
ncbi:probable galacturonosyltransferase 14 isoform X1 [Typha latifolia]|uniref:probable galacturonosyltransferase 14 isoform X1 n=1 Tax=Typha latifolia TaxID=4733 RepID=UPI003C2E6EAF